MVCYKCPPPLTQQALENTLDKLPKDIDAAYICSSQHVYYIDKITREIIPVCDDPEKIKLFTEHLVPKSKLTKLSQEQLDKVTTTIGHQHIALKQRLFYIDANGKSTSITVDDVDEFEKDCIVDLERNLLNVMSTALDDVKSGKYKLKFVPKLSDPIAKECWDSYLYITDDPKAKDKLVRVDAKGQRQPVPYSVREQFDSDYVRALQNHSLSGLTTEQIKTLVAKHGGQTESPVGLDTDAWAAYRKKSVGNIQAQKGTLPLRCYGAAFIRAAADGGYFASGAMGIALFSPSLYIMMVSFSVVFALTHIVTRMYEEYDFQRKLHVTQTQVHLALCVKELDLLLTELGHISKEVAEADVIDASTGRTVSQDSATFKKDDLARQKKLYARFETLSTEYDKHHAVLRGQLVHSYGTAALEGAKNGLAVQAAIMSLMFTIATISLLLGAPCPPAFVVTCVVVGMVMILAFTAQALFSHQQHINKLTAKPHTPLGKAINLQKDLKLKKEDLVLDAKEISEAKAVLWDNEIEASPQYFIYEWSEIIRVLGTGAGKWWKGVADLSGDRTSFTLGVMAVGSVITAGIFSLQALAKELGSKITGASPSKSLVAKLNKPSTEENSGAKATSTSSNTSPPSPDEKRKYNNYSKPSRTHSSRMFHSISGQQRAASPVPSLPASSVISGTGRVSKLGFLAENSSPKKDGSGLINLATTTAFI